MKDKKLIFVVDDDQMMRNNVRRYLEGKGFDVEILNNGSDALLLCMYMIPDLIITDIRMPKLNGITMLKALRNSEGTKDIPVIFMTAFPKDEFIEEAEKFGAKYFLIKPFPLKYLDDLIRRAAPSLMPPEDDNN